MRGQYGGHVMVTAEWRSWKGGHVTVTAGHEAQSGAEYRHRFMGLRVN